MSENERPRDDVSADEILVASLIRLAGPRVEPARASAARVRAAVKAEWRASIANRGHRWRVWTAWVGVAAVGLALAIAIHSRVSPRMTSPADVTRSVVSTVARLAGSATLKSADGTSVNLEAAAEIRRGFTLETGASGRVALRFGDRTSLRIDRRTRVVIESDTRVRLEKGRLYLDVPPGAGHVEIVTPAGTIRHTGTQFTVAVIPGAQVDVSVREGAAVIERPTGTLAVAAAEMVQLVSGDQVRRGQVAASGVEWDWVTEIAPQFVLEGATLEQYLDWVAREQGLRWRFASDTDRKAAAGTGLHGSIAELTPLESLQAVLPTCATTYDVRADVIIVRRERERN